MTTRNHARGWTLGLSSAASLVLGVTLLVHGDAIDQSGQQGAAWMAWGVLFVLIPVLAGIGAAVGVIGREIARERAWKQTLTPQQRLVVQAAETAALYAAWAAVHHKVKADKARTAARLREREEHTRAVIEQHQADVQARDAAEKTGLR